MHTFAKVAPKSPFTAYFIRLGHLFVRTAWATYWLCTDRRPGRRCTASIVQSNDDYRRGNNEHCHRPHDDQVGKTRVQHAV